MRQLQSDMTPGEIRALPTDAGARLTVELVDAPPGPAVRLEFTTYNEDRVAFELPTRQLGDVIDYASWIIDKSRTLPRIVARAHVAHALAAPDASIEDAATGFAGLSDDEIVRVLMGLAARSRVDLAVTLLDRLSRAGRMRDLDALPDADFYESERPRDVSWADLRRWSGANLTANAVESIERRYREIARPYVPTDYIDCFETAFDEQFERIPFATLDVRDVQARLRRLDEYPRRPLRQCRVPARRARRDSAHRGPGAMDGGAGRRVRPVGVHSGRLVPGRQAPAALCHQGLV